MLTWPQLRKQLLLSQHLSGEGVLQPCPHSQWQTVQGQLEGPAEALYFADGEAEAHRGGKG